MMELTITFRKTYSTDKADPILSQCDSRIAEWFVGWDTVRNLDAEGFGLTVEREGK
jgi:hypothetical protein